MGSIASEFEEGHQI